jgi:hypothetical protein
MLVNKQPTNYTYEEALFVSNENNETDEDGWTYKVVPLGVFSLYNVEAFNEEGISEGLL